ncbi:GNAT family N-acetyltransferase [Roseomonas sp. OT10]|uniref:GNAT family N-acetyltransferase n=1 Tax=Roseomonas cutis TaxID=2897332 RepID=UPI001E364246|nr:GNAT family N-acetyltransferase [Roseomonas sp. OT10]UFN47833.1 GNAT family N-acetyltransferase [Roseomonas sp. OT10]
MAETILRADYRDPVHARAVVALMDVYARDPAGGGRPLPPEVLAGLPEALACRPQAMGILAFAGEEPAGLVNLFEGFSTFAGRPLLNIHDVIVAPAFRGRGLAGRMLAEAERLARERGCCKLTLEVLEGNAAARAAYARLGFAGYSLDPGMGQALFWQKVL